METKPGYKTSEFWLSFAALLLGVLVTSGLIDTGSTWDKIVGLATSVLAALGYSSARAKTKAADSLGSAVDPTN